MHEGTEMHMKFWPENLKGRNSLENLLIDVRPK